MVGQEILGVVEELGLGGWVEGIVGAEKGLAVPVAAFLLLFDGDGLIGAVIEKEILGDAEDRGDLIQVSVQVPGLAVAGLPADIGHLGDAGLLGDFLGSEAGQSPVVFQVVGKGAHGHSPLV